MHHQIPVIHLKRTSLLFHSQKMTEKRTCKAKWRRRRWVLRKTSSYLLVRRAPLEVSFLSKDRKKEKKRSSLRSLTDNKLANRDQSEGLLRATSFLYELCNRGIFHYTRKKVLCHDRDSSLSIHLFKVTCPSLSRERAQKRQIDPLDFLFHYARWITVKHWKKWTSLTLLNEKKKE